MIKHTDLRIGNYVLVDNSLQKVSALCIDGNNLTADPLIGYIHGGAIYYEHPASDRVRPVPLTDEMLQQCGFKFDTYFKLWQRMKAVLGTGVEMEMDRDHSALDFSHRPILKNIQYLHELQNLYYVLKREELPMDIQSTKNLQHAN